MAILDIVQYPDPRLRTKAQAVEAVDDEVRKLCADMVETMNDGQGVGLAAPQVGVSKRVIVIGAGVTRSEPIAMINPEIVESSKEKASWEEACLSIPGFIGPVERPSRVKVKCLDQKGEPRELNVGNILAAVIQHEIDHLDGVVYLDHLSQLRRDMINKKVRKRLLSRSRVGR